MIATTPFTDNVSIIKNAPEISNDILEGIESTPYREEDGVGFSIEFTDKHSVSAYLIRKETRIIQDYNPSEGQIEEQNESRRVLIPFRIDWQHNMLEVFSDKGDTKKVVTRLGNVVDWELTISRINLDLSEFYSQLQESKYETTTTSIRLSDFSVSEGTRGNVHLNVFEEDDVDNLVNEHEGDVSYLCSKFELGPEQVTVGFYNSASIQVYNNTNQEKRLIEDIKDIIIESGGIVHE
jgi:hypothetical protein